ncbi:MAG: hypothetical protein ABI968_04325 [Acidobacteriota bacterium]
MEGARSPRRGLVVAVIAIPLLFVAALWLPRWWDQRQFREAQAIAGVGSQMVSGSITDSRKKIDPGVTAEKVEAAIGKPSFRVGTNGKDSRHEIWTYYYADGTMTVNFTDGSVARVTTLYGTPMIPKTTRQD